MKKRILALILALALTVVPAFAEEELQAAPETAETETALTETALTETALTVQQQKNIIREFAHTMADNYYYGVTDQQLLYSVICDVIENGGTFDLDRALEAMLDALGDRYGEFYSPEDFERQTQYYGGEFFGIGVVLTVRGEGTVIESVYSGSPAETAGLKSGDVIIAVDGTDASKMSPADLRGLISGQEGTLVEVTVLRGEETVTVHAVRAKVAESHSDMEIIDGGIAYIDVDSFTRTLPDDFDKYLAEIAEKNIGKVIIDLRDNGGGELNSAIEVAEKLISAGLLCKIKYKNEDMNEDIYSQNYNAPKFDLLVLVNENTASASEMLAMALQSRGRAKLMGTETYGKGSMQLMMQCVTGSGMKFTIGEFYTPDDKRVNTVGLTPDIVVENTVIPVNEDNFSKISMFNIELPGSKLGVEQRLNALGLLNEAYVDGIYDANTETAIRAFQQLRGIEVTGEADFYTVMYLNDYEYDFTKIIDDQMEKAIEYFNN